MKKILITGASGFIGSHLVEKALQMGFETYAGVRKSSSLKYLVQPEIRLVYIDFDKPEEILKLLNKFRFNYIVHNAGTTFAATEDEYKRSNYGNLKVLTDIIQSENIKLEKFIYISSLAAFGPNELNDGRIIGNESVPHPITAYGRSKLIAEEHLKNQNIPYVIIRPTAVYGPRDEIFTSVYRTIERGLEFYLAQKNQKLSFIYVEDLVAAIYATLSGPVKSCYFVSDGNKYTLEEFYRLIKANLGRKTIQICIPKQLSKTVANINEWICKISGRFPVLNHDKVNELSALGWICDSSPIQDIAGFMPRYQLQEGLKKTIQYYKLTKKMKSKSR